MRPVVHGLEKQYEGKVDFLSFDTSDEKKYGAVMKTLKFESTPQFILLRPKGETVRRWTGMVSEKDLKQAIDDLLAQKR
jgi:hypothetical protein